MDIKKSFLAASASIAILISMPSASFAADPTPVSSSPAISNIKVMPNPFSPDGDKVNDVGVISFSSSQKANIRISILNYKGEVKLLWNNFTKEPGDHSVGWTGTNNAGKVLPNGNYQIKIIATTNGKSETFQGVISLKNPSPVLSAVSVSKNPVSPNGDGVDDTTGFVYSLNTSATVTIDIHNWLGKIKTVVSEQKRGPGVHSEGWTGSDLLGHALSNGTYKYVITASNAFGKSSITKSVTVEGVVGGGPRWINIDLSERKLYLKDGNSLLKMYPVAIGRPSLPTPVVTWSVVRKDINPTWYPPEWADVEEPIAYPLSPLGPRRLLLTNQMYGIHGTYNPESIGKAVTHGCIRMYNTDIKQLFDLIPVGTMVKIVA